MLKVTETWLRDYQVRANSASGAEYTAAYRCDGVHECIQPRTRGGCRNKKAAPVMTSPKCQIQNHQGFGMTFFNGINIQPI